MLSHDQLKIQLKTTLTLIYLALSMTACQSLPKNPPNPTKPINTTQLSAKIALTQAIEQTLYHNQDWVAEHQLSLIETGNPLKQDSEIAGIVGCQQRHDNALIAQMQKDHLKTYAQVAKLDSNQRQIYESIKKTYLDCYKIAEANIEKTAETAIEKAIQPQIATLTQSDSEQKSNDEGKDKNLVTAESEENDTEIPNRVNQTATDTRETQTDVLDEIQSISDLKQTLAVLGLNDEQLKSVNNFVTKSGKITITGTYRPLSGYIATQIDAGFENKNLKYHYRVPMVANWKAQAVYIKPDVIMPTIALYLDNKMGMTWQDKWVKFTPTNQPLPMTMTTKNWLSAIKDSVSDLPPSQFEQVSLNELTANISPITNPTQTISNIGTVIHWQQTTKERENLYHDIIERYIQRMDSQIGEKSPTNQAQYEAWQDYKQKLTNYLEQRLAVGADGTVKLSDQSLYFVLNRGQIKQIFANNLATFNEQPVQIHTWVTFDPDTKRLAKQNQPQYLQQLVGSIHDGGTQNNVLDGKQEIKRLSELDKSRRLFGKDPEWLKFFK